MIKGLKKVPINGFPYYEISENGTIYNLRRYIPDYNFFETLPTRVDRGGYKTVRLFQDGRSFTKWVHRLLAEAFLPNPQNKSFINHRSGIKTENDLKNLEFVDHSANIAHAYQHGLIKKCNKEVENTLSGEVYESVKAAAQHNNIAYSTLKNYLNGNRINPTTLQYRNKKAG